MTDVGLPKTMLKHDLTVILSQRSVHRGSQTFKTVVKKEKRAGRLTLRVRETLDGDEPSVRRSTRTGPVTPSASCAKLRDTMNYRQMVSESVLQCEQ